MIWHPAAKFIFRPQALITAYYLRWYKADLNLVETQNPASIAFNLAVQI